MIFATPSIMSKPKTLGTAQLRRHFVVEQLFALGAVKASYTFMIADRRGGTGGRADRAGPELAHLVGVNYLLERRELALINIGGPGRVTADGVTYEVAS
jgi:4-deoxy-L-threo-5-hexosulose-uronate ketol-isomerase